MSYRLLLLCLAVAMVGAFALPSTLYGQSFNGQQQQMLFPNLQNHLRHWEVYRVDAAGLYDFVKNNAPSAPASVQLGQHHWQLALSPNAITAPGYT